MISSIIKSYTTLSVWLNKLLVIEQSCVSCGTNCNQQICQECYLSLKCYTSAPRCPRCLIHLPPKEISCINCAENDFHFNRIIAAYEYAFPLDKILQQLKYHGNLEYSCLLSQLFWVRIAPQLQQLPEVIIPVPLHPNKHKLRGFNQVHELLREFRGNNPDIQELNIIRHRETKQQAILNKAERRANLRDAFKITANLQRKYVVIVDDVVTSGTTVNEIARLCKQLGAAKIDIWCLMRAQT